MAQTDLFRLTPFVAAMDALPVQGIDVGARAGFEPDLLPIAFAVDAVGFEPEPAAFAQLQEAAGSPWRSLRHLPTAISGHAGRRTLHIAADPQSSSLLPPLAAPGVAQDHRAWSDIRTTTEVETETLDGAIARFRVPAPDFLKLDVEGAEGEILAAAPMALASALAVKVEVGFMPLREGQMAAHDVDRLMEGAGFLLMDLIRPARWRRHAGPVHPQTGRSPVPYSRGRLAHGDYLYFRDPATLADDGARALKAAWLAMAYGYFDHAASLLDRPAAAAALAPHLRCDAAEALRCASLLCGRRVWRTALAVQLRGLRPFLRGGAALLRR